MEAPQKIKNKTAISLSNFTSGYLSAENKNTKSKDSMHTNVHCNIIYNRQDTEATWMFTNRRMGKEDVMYIHTQNDILPFATAQMDPEAIMLSEII